jgi:hypothetical protein
MDARLTIAPEAAQDMHEAYGWYEQRRIGLGEEYLGCVEASKSAACPNCIARFTKTTAAL